MIRIFPQTASDPAGRPSLLGPFAISGRPLRPTVAAREGRRPRPVLTGRRGSRPPRGFTLVEVLITIIIMSIGLLGVAGLQLAAMRSNHSAYLRTQATLAAYDVIDRMRVDPASFNGAHFKSDAASDSDAFDDWVRELGGLQLRSPVGESLGEVNCAADNACLAGNCQVTVRWDDSRGEDVALEQTGRATNATSFSVCTRLAQ